MSCLRCGFTTNYRDRLCSSCRARPSRIVHTKFGLCRPHRGDFDADDNPLTSQGKLYRPGLRTCGFRDCVNLQHIWNPIDWERIDPSYRLGDVTLAQYLEMLENERPAPSDQV
jgi:hypothetical protein